MEMVVNVKRMRMRFKHVDDVSLHTYTYTHKYSDFLVAMISVGLALARPNNIILVSQMVTNRSTFQSMLFLRFLNVYNYTS